MKKRSCGRGDTVFLQIKTAGVICGKKSRKIVKKITQFSKKLWTLQKKCSIIDWYIKINMCGILKTTYSGGLDL
jgi:hypothetical protein